MGADLLEKVAAFFGREGFDQMLFGGGEDTLEADDDEIVDEVGVDVLGAAAHVLLFEAAHAFGDGALDFALGHHEEHQYNEFWWNLRASHLCDELIASSVGLCFFIIARMSKHFVFSLLR